MSSSSRFSLALLAACVSLLILATAASAASPATVTVRVEGLSATLLPATQVSTTTTPVVRDGNPEDSCSGTSALGALQTATGGDWDGPWEQTYHQYEINSIEGESHAFSSGYYWDFWLNHAEAQTGACEAEALAGAEVLFFPCSEAAPSCPTPLAIEAPSSAGVKEPVTVIVKQYDAEGEPSPASGARITWNGGSAETEAAGRASVSFGATGSYELHVSGSESGPAAVRAQASVCVHDGNDGSCGTTAAVTGSPAPSTGVSAFHESSTPYTGPFALVSRVAGITEDRVYRAGRGPRLLAGAIISHSAVSSVSLELRRAYRGRCYAYDGTRERFVRARCGQGTPFQVSATSSYSYLLPSALPPGRYVLDVHATDTAGNRLTLARGSSRLVFYVR